MYFSALTSSEGIFFRMFHKVKSRPVFYIHKQLDRISLKALLNFFHIIFSFIILDKIVLNSLIINSPQFFKLKAKSSAAIPSVQGRIHKYHHPCATSGWNDPPERTEISP
jgi:hypothetical protein